MKKSAFTDVKPSELIKRRDGLNKEISRYWEIIAKENVIKKGLMRNYNLKVLLTQIRALYDQLVLVKLNIQCINMGMKFKDLTEDMNVVNIYRLSALNEYCVKIDEMIDKHTLNPVLKAKKGKRGLGVTEEITRSYFRNKKNECALLLNKLRKNIADFNDNTDLSDDEVPAFLTV